MIYKFYLNGALLTEIVASQYMYIGLTHLLIFNNKKYKITESAIVAAELPFMQFTVEEVL